MNDISVAIPYGSIAVQARIPGRNLAGVLQPRDSEALGDENDIVISALQTPIGSPRLCEIARGKKNVLVITSDHTRPVPSRVTMPLILGEIRRGNPEAQIIILIATGMHRPTTKDEIATRFGPAIAENERIAVHDCKGPCVFRGILPSLGRLMLNPLVDWAELTVAEGFIEPHFFAGFSGGRKSVLPGIASEETVRYNHNASFISNPHSRQGVLEDNPIHRDMIFAARAAGLEFILNTIIGADKRIAAAVAGDFQKAHERGCEICLERTSVKKVLGDIVITGNGGYPLDQNVYQAVKGMTAAEACVRSGGVIIMCAECRDGHGGESFYGIASQDLPASEILERIERAPSSETPADQWEAQILLRVALHARVIFVTMEKNRDIIEKMRMRFAPDIDAALRMAFEIAGPDANVVVIPDGVGVIARD